MRTSIPLLALAVALVGAHPALAQSKSRRMTDEAVRAKGLVLQKVLDADLDGDGRKEVLGVTSGSQGVQVVLVGEDAQGATVTQVVPPALGKELLKADVKHLVGPATAQQLILEVLDETPDEKVKRLRIYGADGSGATVRVKEVFSTKIERARNAEARPEWETDPNVVKYGDPRAGWYFEDLQDDGLVEILVRRNSGAKLVPVKAADGAEVRLLTGVRETVFAWDADRARYSKGEERLNDFLPAYAIEDVDASSAWVDPKILKALKAQALSDALQQAASGGGDAEGAADTAAETNEAKRTSAAKDTRSAKGAKSTKSAKGSTTGAEDAALKVDLAPFIKTAADGNIATAWIEGDEKGAGKGEWVEVTLEDQDAVHMVRLVLGCAESKQSMKGHNVPESFSIQLDNGSPREVDLRAKGKFEPGVVAFSDELVKLADRPWVKTTLVFLDGKTEAKKVRVTLGNALKQGRGNRTCISEISVH